MSTAERSRKCASPIAARSRRPCRSRTAATQGPVQQPPSAAPSCSRHNSRRSRRSRSCGATASLCTHLTGPGPGPPAPCPRAGARRPPDGPRAWRPFRPRPAPALTRAEEAACVPCPRPRPRRPRLQARLRGLRRPRATLAGRWTRCPRGWACRVCRDRAFFWAGQNLRGPVDGATRMGLQGGGGGVQGGTGRVCMWARTVRVHVWVSTPCPRAKVRWGGTACLALYPPSPWPLPGARSFPACCLPPPPPPFYPTNTHAHAR